MNLLFAWRYFTGKKKANAINIIAWVTTGVIAFATCCQVLVLSVFNGFEDLVKSLYASFYSDLRIVPKEGKTFIYTAEDFSKLRALDGIAMVSGNVEDKALLKNQDQQSVVQIKGVDENFVKMSGVPADLIRGDFELGTPNEPKIVVGAGIQSAVSIALNDPLSADNIVVILPRRQSSGVNPLESLSEGNVYPSGVFAIQQDFDNKYVFSNIDFVRRQMGVDKNTYSAIELKLKDPGLSNQVIKKLSSLLPSSLMVQTKYQQNSNLYSTMRLEKWAIFAVLTLILVIAAFNMISSLTMLVLEKQQDIAILRSMGASQSRIRSIFLSEGVLLAAVGAAIGIGIATIICILQLKFKLIKLQGGSFVIDYFPVKLIATDFLLVAATITVIAILSSWSPAAKAARQQIALR
jgi:lipoprotein-releasing system permease protein